MLESLISQTLFRLQKGIKMGDVGNSTCVYFIIIICGFQRGD